MREIAITNQYKKDLKAARKQRLPEQKLDEIIHTLACDEPLPAKCRDHALHGNLEGFRECHIEPDWLLIYRKEDTTHIQLLLLVRTGTHAKLFGM